jgi:phosphatidylserine decarboxylase
LHFLVSTKGKSSLIARYGYDVAVVVFLLCGLSLVATWALVDARILKIMLTVVVVCVASFTLYFFRDPERTTPTVEGGIVAPADGKIIQVKELHDDEYMHGDAVQIAIFMSPLNVHVNRYPLTGRVTYFRHFPGEFLVAFDEKASLRNERTHIGIEGERCRVLFKQIAGFVARRIVAEVREGDQAVVGTRFGMIKFGSRVDVLLPRTADVKVRVGDITVAGETILAVVPHQG